MTTLIGLLLFAIFLALSGMHIYWLFGGKWGLAAAIPTNGNGQSLFKPGALATIIVAVGLLLTGMLALVGGGLLHFGWLPDGVGEWAALGMAIIFLLRAVGEFRYVGFFKKERESSFAKMDSKYYSPLCLVIGVLAVLLAVLQ